jgi:predicted ArsR family transcriptional regulator
MDYKPKAGEGETMTRILHYMENSEDPVSPLEVANHLTLNNKCVMVYLGRLVKRGVVVKVHRAQYIALPRTTTETSN